MGGYLIAEGSRNANGEYVCLDQADPQPCPEWIATLIASVSPQNKAGTTEDSTDHRIPEGQRHVALCHLAGVMRRSGMSAPAIQSALLADNENRCDPPLADGEVHRIAADIGAKEPGLPADFANRAFHLIGDEDLGQQSKPDDLVAGRLVAGSFVEIYGPSGVGKSFLCVDLAFAVATGGLWLGAPVRQRGPVVYVLAEGLGLFGKRVQAWKEHHNVCGPAGVHFVTRSVDLCDRRAVSAFIETVRPLQPRAVIFDTLNRCIPGADENSQQDMSRMAASCDQIRADTGAMVLLIHHPNKGNEVERGTNLVRCDVDTLIKLKAHKGKVVVTCQKQRDGAPFGEVRFRLQPVEVEGDTACVVEIDQDGAHASPHDELMLQILISAGSDGLESSEWRRRVTAEDAVSESTFYRRQSALVESGHALRVRKGRYVAAVPRLRLA